MSEIKSEAETPFLTLRGSLTEEARIRAYRAGIVRLIMIRVLIFIAAVLVMGIGINLYYGLPPFLLETLFGGGLFWIMLAVVIIAYAVEGLWLRPRRLRKNLREMYGAPPWETQYDFYNSHFTSRLSGTKNSPDMNLDYADLKKIKVYRYYILLQTKTKNRLSLTREELSYEDEQKLLETLRERSGLE